MSLRTTLTILTCLGATGSLASEGFVEANVLGIFYHELGHAVIDIEGVPIFGQEEDAADVFSIFMIDAVFATEAAVDLAYDIALGFWAEAEARTDDGDEVPWWDVHGPDEQRFFNTVCLFYGADPEAREGFADDLDLPEDRADYCPEEYNQAQAAWGAVLDRLQARGSGKSLVFKDGDGSLTATILAEEVEALNAEFQLSEKLVVRMESCGEANAFYDPHAVEIIYCTEFEEHLERLAR